MTYWLIEAHDQPKWLRIRQCRDGGNPSGQIIWTNNAHEALQFSRRQDAEDFCFLHPEAAFLARLTEHMDIGS